MAEIAYPKLEKCVISLDISDDEALENDRSCEMNKIITQSSVKKKGRRNEEEEEQKEFKNSNCVRSGGDADKDKCVRKTKAEESLMLADLSSFPQLAAMFSFEARMKKRKRNENEMRKMKLKMESEALEKQEKMAATEDPKLEKFVILLDSSDDEAAKHDRSSEINESATQLSEAKKREHKEEVKNCNGVASGGDADIDKYVCRTKADEYRMLADLSSFPQLAAMFAFEAKMKERKKRNRNKIRTMKQKMESEAPNAIDSSDGETLKNDGSSEINKFATQSSETKKREQSEEEVKEVKNRNGTRSGDDADKGKSVYRTKEEEYRMLGDLSGFPELAAMFAFEARMKKKSKMRKMQQKPESEATNATVRHLYKQEKMAATEDPQLEKPVILLGRSDEEALKNDRTSEINKSATQFSNGIGSGGDADIDKYVYRTKAEEYRMLADLSSFPQLAAMFAFDARMKKSRKRNRNKIRMMKQKMESEAPNGTKPEKVAANEHPKFEKLVISQDINDGEAMKNDGSCKINKIATQWSDTEKREQSEEEVIVVQNSNGTRSGGDADKGKYVHRTKAEKYRMLGDLSGFPKLVPIFAFKDRMKKREKRIKHKTRNMKQKMESETPNATAYAAKENKQANTCKDAETTEEVKAGNDVRSDVVIDLNSPPWEGDEETADVKSFGGPVESMPTEAIGRKKGRRKRRKILL